MKRAVCQAKASGFHALFPVPAPRVGDSLAGAAVRDWFVRQSVKRGRLRRFGPPILARMEAGDVVAERFEIEQLAGRGGMGEVFRARDRHSGATVALKVVSNGDAMATQRFAREARLLAELRHPRVVRYVAHGDTAQGEPYLAMEWLEGEDLAERLTRGPLTFNESVDVARHVAEALAAGHARGLVHRDIKPGNLYLPDRDLGRLKVLDFGLAHLSVQPITRTGAQLGTPGYMAPEQARGAVVDACADVFSLGCVLYQCLTGKRPFVGDHVVAVLAKVLFEEAPPLTELVPGIPAVLNQLVTRMLAKDPALRPPNGAAVIEALDALASIDDGLTQVEVHRSAPAPATLMSGETRLLSVVLARNAPRAEVDSDDAPTLHYEGKELESLRALAKGYGGQLERLVDGSVVVTISGTRAATDQASLAARCALALRTMLPTALMVLATGRGKMEARWPVGEAIDRATALMTSISAPAASDGSVHIDELTAGLLGERFDVRSHGRGHVLRGERDAAEEVRTLLGKPTPCVGRESELAMLQAVFEECIEEPVARAVVVTGPAGIGKSRLRYEFLRRVQQSARHVQIWMGHCDPLSAGSPFGVLGRALRRAAGVIDGEPLAARRNKLRARVARHFQGADLQRIIEFIGEIAGVPFPDESVQLRAARLDPHLMADQTRRAWEELLTAECAAEPVLLVLEDLQWGDLPSVEFIDASLRRLHDRPFMVLALARPKIEDLFPKLWHERRTQPVPLGTLTRRASERLVRKVLGDGVSADMVARLVERAGGNAFYLEELIRSQAEGRIDLPETILAMLQTRLEGLEPEARRILRAASVFGQVFWRGAVLALMGIEQGESLDEWLGELTARELIARREGARFPGETEFMFRHSLVSEAAHAMLTEQDRTLGHRLAGDWLEHAGELDAMVLAEHFERGGDSARAATMWRRAAQQAMDGNNFDAVLERTSRGLVLGAEGETFGQLRLLQADAYVWRAGPAKAETAARDALGTLDRSNPLWWRAAAAVSELCIRLGNNDGAKEMGLLALEALRTTKVHDAAQAVAVLRVARALLYTGFKEISESLIDRVSDVTGHLVSTDPLVAAQLYAIRSDQAQLDGDGGTTLEWTRATARSFELAGDRRSACQWRGYVGYVLRELGAHAEGAVILRECAASARAMGLEAIATMAKHNLGLALALSGEAEEGCALEEEAVRALAANGDTRLEAAGRLYLAMMHLDLGDLEKAEREVRKVITTASGPVAAVASAVLGRVLLAKGELDQALEVSERANALLEELGGLEEGEASVRLAYAETLYAKGLAIRATSTIEAARDRLFARASKIKDPTLRESFLKNVPEHARTVALARQWTRHASVAPVDEGA
jgi:tetratricopeptide (TPR) repeat protein